MDQPQSLRRANGLRVSRWLEGTTLIDRECLFAASGRQNRPDPAGRLHALVGPPAFW
jgi:hypothetical protein